MFFGPLPQWGGQLCQLLPLDQLMPPSLAAREPAFDQAIVNLYRPGEGITDHVDLARFQDGIVGVSMGGPVVMDFRRLPGGGWEGSAGGGGGRDSSRNDDNRGEGSAATATGDGGGTGGISARQELVPEAAAAAGYCSREAVERLLQTGDGEDDDAEGDEQEPLHPQSGPRDGVWWIEDEEAVAEASEEPDPWAAAANSRAAGQAGEAVGPHHVLAKGRLRRRRRHLRVLLQGGDLIGMSGEARYGWTHGIAQGVTCERVVMLPDQATAPAASRRDQEEEEEEMGVLRHVSRGVRLSVTLRRLVPHIVLSEQA
ncbi:hypothetical protein HYH02_011039 [Chlamydomonas schloesseri]|uniref:Alpha-ketoglutarate-dependent dioxygenase AlkB-like domain-containing protein n=1 Tax=Chlamydomonas schloesseri TaxID=2026947 RepID=A0A835T7G2_9CHLO|nr:hypothetical protein HYH02_011039 [Chlamydomonas schloesseri]|eukprot:KAG2437658.1 hypothetical protein HYH02_011039 [Chlamydomonas schloesseri]